MIDYDRKEVLRINSRNELMKLIINVKKKYNLAEYGHLKFEIDQYSEKLIQIEQWMHEQGDNAAIENFEYMKSLLNNGNMLKKFEEKFNIEKSIGDHFMDIDKITGVKIGCQKTDDL